MNPILAFALAFACSGFLWSISSYFKPRFKDCKQVVMQWGLDSKPKSYAPPKTALMVTPCIGTIALLGTAALISFATPVEERGLPSFAMMLTISAVFCAIHFLHMHFALRAADRERGH